MTCIRGAAATEYLTTVGGALVIGYGLYHFATTAKAKVSAQGNALAGVEETLPSGTAAASKAGAIVAGLPDIPGTEGLNAERARSSGSDPNFAQRAHDVLSPNNGTGEQLNAPDPNRVPPVRMRIESADVRRQLAHDTGGVTEGEYVIIPNDRRHGEITTQTLNDQGYYRNVPDNASPEFRQGVRAVGIQTGLDAVRNIVESGKAPEQH